MQAAPTRSPSPSRALGRPTAGPASPQALAGPREPPPGATARPAPGSVARRARAQRSATPAASCCVRELTGEDPTVAHKVAKVDAEQLVHTLVCANDDVPRCLAVAG